MNSALTFVHAHAVGLIVFWAVASNVVAALPSPEAFAAYFDLPKAPNWYKATLAIAHFAAMNIPRVIPQLRMAGKDKA